MIKVGRSDLDPSLAMIFASNVLPEDLIKIDAKEGTYVYHRDNVKLILRKKKDMGFDPMKTISTFI